MISGGTTGENLNAKFAILKEQFDNKFGSNLIQLDPRRFFTQPMKMEIFRRANGRCFFYDKAYCTKTAINFNDSDSSYHHKQFHHSGGKTVADNGALCHLNCHRKFHDETDAVDDDLQ